jgi:hypothetical protein
MADSVDEGRVTALEARLAVLEAEAEIRRLMARYMWLCDTPCPEPGGADDARRIELVVELFTDDAIWEGVGEYYDGQFGRSVGRSEVLQHFQGFWNAEQDPVLLLNAHYLTSEQIYVESGAQTAEGQWIHMQPWLFADGTALLRSSRLHNGFRREGDVWKISRYRTENVFVAPLPESFASNYGSVSVLKG